MKDAWFRRSADTIWDEVEGKLVVYNPNTGTFSMLNDTGRMIWEMLGNWTTLERLVHHVIERYSIDKGKAWHDVERFIKALQERQLLEFKGIGQEDG